MRLHTAASSPFLWGFAPNRGHLPHPAPTWQLSFGMQADWQIFRWPAYSDKIAYLNPDRPLAAEPEAAE